MKNLVEYSQEELAQWEEKDIVQYAQWRCVQTGKQFMAMQLPEKPVKPEVVTDLVLYNVAGIVVDSQEIADQIAVLLSKTTIYDVIWYNNPPNVYGTKSNRVEVSVGNTVSADLYKRIRKDLEEYREKDEKYKELVKHNEENLEFYHECIEDAEDAVSSAKSHLNRREELRDCFASYYSLAENNFSTAWTFFAKAYPVHEFPKLHELLEQDYAPVGEVTPCQ